MAGLPTGLEAGILADSAPPVPPDRFETDSSTIPFAELPLFLSSHLP
ncbi:MAG: hypothetical protein WBM14_08640 [Terracidiphilus sp.]|jgi:hypothetical protein